jgi:hypothetical protein
MAEIRPEVRADLQAVVLRCLEKERERRFQDIPALDYALASCQQGEPWTEVQAADWWQRHGATPRANDLQSGKIRAGGG